MYKIFFFLIIFLIQYVHASEIGNETGLEIPRFVSLKSDEINLRVGPSINYPIKIKYVYQNFPVEIIEEYDVWRKVRDNENNTGWIKGSLLKGDRYGIVISKEDHFANIYKYPTDKSVGKIGINNLVKINKCLQLWCLINSNKNKFWIKKKNLWGVYELEKFNLNMFQPIINFYWKILNTITKQ